ncbi:MAG: ATP-binding cassette domain-containing protein [Actinomycetota bacterium]|nr:ATP-binding cassette domain-containing protein [Actinomycetota bacterium]
MSPPRLAVRGLSAGWRGTAVLSDLDVSVRAGQAVGVLGGNGSGKSSLLFSIAGLLPVATGSVILDGVPVGGWSAERRAARGIRLLDQSRRVFPTMTVAENLAVVEHGIGHPDVGAIRRRRGQWLERFPALADRLDVLGGTLSGGEQQLLAIGRVLTTGPVLLLLDEPSAGLSPALRQGCAAVFRDLLDDGVAILLVEQDAMFARRISDVLLHLRAGRLEPVLSSA